VLTKLGWIPDDWGNLSMDDLIQFSGGSQPPRETFKYQPQEGYLRLIQTRDYRTNEHKTFIKKEDARKVCDIDDIMIGRYGPPIFQLFRGLKGAYNVALIKAIPKSKNILKTYAWYFLNRKDLRNYLESLSQRSGGQTGIEMGRLKKYPFPLPPLSEQKKIADILSTWDKAIETTQALIEKLQLRKKGLMQQLLSGKKRLPGFSLPAGQAGGEWEEISLGEIGNRLTKKNVELNDNVVTISAQRGFVRQEDFFKKRVASKTLSGYYLIDRGHFAYNKSYSKGYPMGAFKRLDDFDKAVVTTLYICFEITDNADSDFMLYYFEGGMLVRNLMKIAQEGGRAHGLLNISLGDFFGLKMTIPSKREQTAIAKVLTKMDEEINQTQQYLEQLQAQKKGLMQQLLTGQKRVTV
jgi:type I restriction enzyme S subunit